jgi:PAS domain S-box-containing protein
MKTKTRPGGELAAQERDDRYAQLVEFSPDGILVQAEGRIILANASAVRLAGAPRRASLIGLPIEALLDPPYLKAVEGHLRGQAGSPEVNRPITDTLHRLDGAELPVEVRAVAFVDRGRPSAHLVIRDITERLAAIAATEAVDERLKQAQRMEAVGALAGGVAHEVNNMLQVVLGFSAALVNDSRLPAECLPDVRHITEAASRAATVTAQLLAYSRRAVHRPEVVDLVAAVHAAEPMLCMALSRGQQVVVRGSALMLASVDPGQLRQVLVNLALNAAAAMDQGGTLSITTAPIELTTAIDAVQGGSIPPGRYGVIHVRDSGSGIPAETMAHIFEPFFTTKPLGQGTGLGLAGALGMLAQNGGYVTVSSAEGEGTTFSLYLPLLADGVLPTPRQPDPAPVLLHPGSALVLVVDDEEGLRSVVCRMLREAGYQVAQAANGAEALEYIAAQGPPALLLTDLMMPGIGGVELAERLAILHPTMPVMFMSGYSTEMVQHLMTAGAAGQLLQKPFTVEELLAGVATVLAHHSAGVRH